MIINDFTSRIVNLKKKKKKSQFLFFMNKVLVCLLTLILSSCNSNELANDRSYTHESFPIYTAQLINELNNDPNTEGFGNIIFLELLNSGDFYINDLNGNTLHKFNQDGQLISKVSKEGRGPGEFLVKNIKSEFNLDQMGIYDPILSRVTIMDLELDSVIKTHDFDNDGLHLELLGFNSDEVFFKAKDSYTLQNYDEPKYLRVFSLKFDSNELVPLKKFPPTEFHATVNQERRSIHLNYLPLGRKSTLRKLNDSFIYINNSGFGYTKFNNSGEIVQQDSMSLNQIEPYALSSSQFDQHVKQLAGTSLPENIRSEIISELRSNADKDTQIWFQDSFVDLNGRFWFELPSLIFDNESRWIVWDAVDEKIYQILFEDSNVKPQNALNNRIIAFSKSEYDLQTVQIYNFSY